MDEARQTFQYQQKKKKKIIDPSLPDSTTIIETDMENRNGKLENGNDCVMNKNKVTIDKARVMKPLAAQDPNTQ